MGILEWFRNTGHLFLVAERRCALCLTPFVPSPLSVSAPQSFAARLSLCPTCRAGIPRREGGYCTLCGEPAAAVTAPPMPCAACLTTPPSWETFRFYGIYEGLLRLLVLRTKYRGDAACARVLGELALSLCSELPQCDALVPMPPHPARLRTRGFNQCMEAARLPSAALGVPLCPQFLSRIGHERSQTLQRRAERRANLAASFIAHPDVRGLRILLLDDTMTTGSTLRGATHRLLHAGAKAVCVVVAARSPLYH